MSLITIIIFSSYRVINLECSKNKSFILNNLEASINKYHDTCDGLRLANVWRTTNDTDYLGTGVWVVSAVQLAVTISQSPFRATHVSDRANGGRFHGDESLPVIIGA